GEIADELWHMVYLMAYRTSPLRSALRTVGEGFIDFLHSKADSSAMRERVLAHFAEHFDENLEEALNRLPPAIATALRENREVFKAYAARGLESTDLGALVRTLLGEVKKQESFQSAPKRGHNQGVSKLIEQGRGPGAAKPVTWRILEDPSGSVILGDCPGGAVSG